VDVDAHSAGGRTSRAPRRQAVFGPGTNIPRAAADLLDKLNAELGYSPKAAAE